MCCTSTEWDDNWQECIDEGRLEVFQIGAHLGAPDGIFERSKTCDGEAPLHLTNNQFAAGDEFPLKVAVWKRVAAIQ